MPIIYPQYTYTKPRGGLGLGGDYLGTFKNPKLERKLKYGRQA